MKQPLVIRSQGLALKTFYLFFGILTLLLMTYYLSDTLFHSTTSRQFPINSFIRFPLTFLIFPAEIFSFLFALYFVYTLSIPKSSIEKRPELNSTIKSKEVAILIPAYHEPKTILERTIKACKQLKWYSKVNIYLLDDSQDIVNKKMMSELAHQYKINLVRRSNWIGKKAGNINNAIKNEIGEEYFVIFDSDQAPKSDFLLEMMPFFIYPDVGFVQAPQHFINDERPIERAAKIGTNIFYRAQSIAKAKDGAMPFCGTNVIVKTSVFREVNGFLYYTPTEDIDLGLRMNQKGYRGAYVPMILVEGYAPKDFRSYSIQQYRWANGNLAILRENFFKILGGNFSLRYTVHTFFTLAWWLIGLVTLLYITTPFLSAIFGVGTHHTWLPTALLLFLFFHIILGISMIYFSILGRVEGERVTIKDAFLQYSLITNSIFIYFKASFNALVLRKYASFKRTNKEGENSSFWDIKWNLFFASITFIASIYALYFAIVSNDIQQLRTNLPISIWLLFYSMILFSSIIFIDNKNVGGENE